MAVAMAVAVAVTKAPAMAVSAAVHLCSREQEGLLVASEDLLVARGVLLAAGLLLMSETRQPKRAGIYDDFRDDFEGIYEC